MTPNQGWRNVNLPSRNGTGERLTNPPLALNLHYLLTAYGAQDFNAEILLGYAMQLLHETPVFARRDIRLAHGSDPSGVSPVGTGLFSPFGDLSRRISLIMSSRLNARSFDDGRAQTVDSDAGALPSDHGLSGVGGAHSKHALDESAVARLQRGRDDRGITTVPSPLPPHGVTPPNLQAPCAQARG